MKKEIFFLSLSLLILITACTSNVTKSSLSEPADPDTYDMSVWDAVSNNLNAAYISTNDAVNKSVPPVSPDLSESQILYGWKGERVHAQLVVWANDFEGHIKLNNYLQDQNKSVPASFEISTVRYVITDSFINGCGWRDKDTIDSHISPDRLEPSSSFDIKNKETRPVWLTMQIPSDCEEGNYTYVTEIISSTDTICLNIDLEVLDRTLPDPSDWKFHLDLWQNPYAVARYNNVQVWSQEHWELLDPLLTKLASAGQKCITTTINDKPWGGQTFDPFGSMINWIKDVDGNWTYDYSIFDQYVDFAMSCGITKQINCYTMVPWGNRFTYFDEDSTKYVNIEARPGSPEYIKFFTPFLIDFREHLRDKGWLEITSIAMDERGEEDMKAIISLIKNNVPEMKISLAGHIVSKELDKDIYDLSIGLRHDPDKEKVKARVKSGKPTTLYTYCAAPESPNNFTFSPPADNTYIGWFVAGWGYSGFLRWAYNSWVENPEYDSRFRTWPSGDTYFVYPGAVSSIRFEKLIEGIQDYEKIRILKDELANDASIQAAELEVKLNNFLDSLHFSQLKERPSKEFILEGQNLLYRIVKR